MSEVNKNFIFLQSFFQISPEVFSKLQGIAEFKILKPRTKLVSSNDVPGSVFLLNKGVVRAFSINDNGKELNKQLFVPISFFGGLSALIKNTPSHYSYETLTRCEVFEIDFNRIIAIKNTNIEVSNLYSKILEHVFIDYENRINELLSLDSTERYLSLRSRIPNIDNLIPQFQIASYLGITPVQLSRIRKSMY